jgi:hypothetical protein
VGVVISRAEPAARLTDRLVAPCTVEPWRSAIVLALFAAMLAAVGPRHEPWFDEAQAWLIARDSTLWDMLAHRVRYEGTPGLWHVLLWLLAQAGMPFRHLWMVSSALAWIGAFIILTRAPFPYWLRVGVIFSYFVAYQYAIVARSYALDLMLLPLIAATFADRLRRPVVYGLLLGLAANVNAHSFIIAGALGAEILFTLLRRGGWKAEHFVGGAIYAAFAGAAVLQAWPPKDASFFSVIDKAHDASRGLTLVSEAFIDRFDIWSTLPPTESSTLAGFVISVLLLVPSMRLFRAAGLGVFVGVVVLALGIFSIMTFANAWHAGLLYLFWIMALWIGWHALRELPAAQRRVIVASIATIVFVNVAYTGHAAWRDFREPYSAAPVAAQLVAGDARIAAIGIKAFAVQPWFGANAFANYRGGAPDPAYYAWMASETLPPVVTAEAWSALTATRDYDAVLLSRYKGPIEHDFSYATVARAAGYCKAAEIPGGLIWRSYVREYDGLTLFRPCDAKTAAAPNARR